MITTRKNEMTTKYVKLTKDCPLSHMFFTRDGAPRHDLIPKSFIPGISDIPEYSNAWRLDSVEPHGGDVYTDEQISYLWEAYNNHYMRGTRGGRTIADCMEDANKQFISAASNDTPGTDTEPKYHKVYRIDADNGCWTISILNIPTGYTYSNKFKARTLKGVLGKLKQLLEKNIYLKD